MDIRVPGKAERLSASLAGFCLWRCFFEFSIFLSGLRQRKDDSRCGHECVERFCRLSAASS